MKALKLVLLLLFIIKLTASYSQNDTPKFQFGVKASPAISWLSPETKFYKNDGTKLGFAWGFVTDFHLLNNYFISTGFSVNYVNGKLKFPSEVQVESIVVKGTMLRDYRMRFLEFPFLFKMKTNSFGDYRFYGQMGFITGFNIKSRSVDVFYPETGPTINDELDIYDETTFARINLAVGGGAEYKIDNSTSIFFGLMFHNGLTDVLSGKNPVDFRTEKAVPNALEVTFGVMF
ncbi:MAG: porin family protein [Bacteroidales bacterium]|nr:porin family protein [Bacteroidales bacterium]